jgi:hypothetical protein
MGDVTVKPSRRTTRPALREGADRRLPNLVGQQKMLVSYPLPAQFSRRYIRGYDRDQLRVFVTDLTWGKVGRAGRDPMTTQPIGPQSAGSTSHWYTSSPTCNRSYLLAGLRAGLIALVLLAILAVIVWF